MSHSNRNRFKAPLRQREAQPRAQQTRKGAIILCPFCTPTHRIVPGTKSPCGAVLKVTVVQTTISASAARKNGITCIKCKQVGVGELAPYFDGFVHIKDCNPSIVLAPTKPKFSPLAGLVSKLPKNVREKIEKRTGHAQAVHLIDPEGHETGKIAGFYFEKVTT